MEDDILVQAANAWQQLCNTGYEITYGYKGGLTVLKLSFNPEDFYHLAGFHYLKDISLPRFNHPKVLQKVKDGTLSEELLQQSSFYKSMLVPRLKALIEMEHALDSDFVLYSYMPRFYPFPTTIQADYLLAYHSEYVSFMFIIESNPATEENTFTFCSAFLAGDRNYETNQRSRTILKKVKRDLINNIETVLYQSRHLKEKNP